MFDLGNYVLASNVGPRTRNNTYVVNYFQLNNRMVAHPKYCSCSFYGLSENRLKVQFKFFLVLNLFNFKAKGP